MSIEQRMSNEELTALAGLTFDWTRALDDVWTDQRYHVDGLHAVTAALIGSGIRTVTADGARPLGIVIQGQRGVGKTHLLGWTREQVQDAGGFFFLVGDLFTKAFWEQVLGSMVEQLLPLPDGSRNQLAALLTRLADQVGLDGSFRAQVTGEVPPTPEGVKVFIAALRRTAPSLGLICQDTARALVLLASPLQEDQDVGYYYLTGNEVDLQDRRHWRINSTRKIPRLLVNEVSQLLALAGPIVLAIDQVDALIDELVGRSADDAAQSRPLADVATGLMALRDVAHRTLTIVSCLPESWEYIRKYGVDTVTDRFREARQLRNIPSADVGRLMIEKRFAVDFGRAGFEPPYPTWPILPAAFDEASKYTARALLKRIEAHVGRCLQDQNIVELDHLDESPDGAQPVTAATGGPAESPGLAALDLLFARLSEQAASAPRSTRRPRTRRCRRCSRPASRPGPGNSAGPTTRRSFRTRCRARTRGCTPACGCSSTPGPNVSAAGRSAPSPRTARGPCRPGSRRRSRGRPGRRRRRRRQPPAVRAQVGRVAERPGDRAGGGRVRGQGRRAATGRRG